MSEEYGSEEFADIGVEELRAFINTEERFIEEEHALSEKLFSWDSIYLHLEERIPENMPHFIKLTREIAAKFDEIRNLLEFDRLKDLKIEKEEEHILQKLEKDVKHRDWKAVREDIDLETKEERKVLRLQIHEIKELHSRFKELMELVNGHNLKFILDEDLTTQKQKEEYKRLEEYYFIQIYKFILAYERIFRHLWEKEKILYEKAQRISKRMK